MGYRYLIHDRQGKILREFWSQRDAYRFRAAGDKSEIDVYIVPGPSVLTPGLRPHYEIGDVVPSRAARILDETAVIAYLIEHEYMGGVPLSHIKRKFWIVSPKQRAALQRILKPLVACGSVKMVGRFKNEYHIDRVAIQVRKAETLGYVDVVEV